MSGDIRTALVVAAVRHGIAAEQDDFTVPELRLASHLHRQLGEQLSALQYDEIAARCVEWKEVDVGAD